MKIYNYAKRLKLVNITYLVAYNIQKDKVMDLESDSNFTILQPFKNRSLPSKHYNISWVIATGILSSGGLLLYVTVWCIMLLNYKHFKSTFYLYILSAGIPDMLNLLTELCYCLPSVVLQHDVNNLFERIVGILKSFVSQAEASHTLAIALNRMVYASFKTYQKFNTGFGGKRCTIFAILCIYSFSLAIVVIEACFTCWWRYSFQDLSWELRCSKVYLGTYGKYLGATIILTVSTLASIFYVITWVLIKKRQNQVSSLDELRKKRELRLLREFSILTVSVSLDSLLYFVSTFDVEWKYGSIVVSMVDILNSTINPIVYLIWDNKLKMLVKKTITNVATYGNS